VSPQCPPDNKWVDSDWTKGTYSTDSIPQSNELLIVLKILDSLIDEFNIDINRQYVTGLSMGGYGTWDMVARYPDRFAAAIPMSASGDTLKANQFEYLPIWNFHGAMDDVVPVKGSREMNQAMINSGLNVIQTYGVADSILDNHIANNVKHLYTEYPNGKHSIWTESYFNPRVANWLFSQERSPAVGIKENQNNIKNTFKINQNYPNPFNPTTSIEYFLPRMSDVRISIYDILGRKVATLLDKVQDKGDHKIVFDADNLISGIYFYQIKYDKNLSQTKKMILLR